MICNTNNAQNLHIDQGAVFVVYISVVSVSSQQVTAGLEIKFCGPSNWECWGGLQKFGAHIKIKLEFKSYKRYSSATCFSRYRFTNIF